MTFGGIAVLTSKKSWFVPYAEEFVQVLKKKSYKARLFFEHEDVGEDFDIVFVLSYFRIIKKDFLEKHRHSVVVHESSLPRGRGWAPLFWQILDGKSKVPIVLFEATDEVDEGPVYLKDYIVLKGHELHDEIRKKQAVKTMELCERFLDGYSRLKPVKQKGKPSYYRRRNPEDSKLSLNKTIREQFNLLRIVNNDEFPAFFNYKGHKYIIKILKEDR